MFRNKCLVFILIIFGSDYEATFAEPYPPRHQLHLPEYYAAINANKNDINNPGSLQPQAYAYGNIQRDHNIDLTYRYSLGPRQYDIGKITVFPRRDNVPFQATSYNMLLEYLRIKNLALTHSYPTTLLPNNGKNALAEY